MKLAKKVVGILTLMTVVMGSLTGCGQSTDAKETGAVASENSGGVEANGEQIELVFWHSMGGVAGEALQKLTDEFNASQEDITVQIQYQGSYDEATNKLKSATVGNSTPDIMQLYDIGTRWMIDSEYACKMQDFINAEGFDISNLEENILAYYSIEDELYSMPFNSSTPILYYNKDLFKEAGLDPEVAPKSLDEMITYAEKIAKKDGDKVTTYGANIQIYGWFFEQFLVKAGLDYANNGNGRTEAATAVSFDENGGGVRVMEKWLEAVEAGNMANLGRDSDINQAAFTAGDSAMLLASTASLSGIKASIDGKFELGTAYFPGLTNEDTNGVSIGGGSLWIMNKEDEAKQNAAWEFVKYLISPEAQVTWSQATGYFPITKEAYDLPEMTAHLEAHPEFKTAIDQLHESNGSTGALLAVFPEARACIEENIEKLLNHEMTAQEAVSSSAATINKAIERYNKTK